MSEPASGPYSFRLITADDLPMLARWLATPAVREWWVDATGQPSAPFDKDDLDDPRVSLWIVAHEARPFAFIQDYDPHGWPRHHFGDLPVGARGIDQFIGEPTMIGRGHGSTFIRQHCDELMSRGARVIGTDPHPGNARAIRAYEKAGFLRGQERQTAWGRSLLMTRGISASMPRATSSAG